MSNINHVLITGNLTRDPVLKSLPTGLPILDISLASGTYATPDDPLYIDVTLYGPRAPHLNNFLRKGSKVAIAGALHRDTWKSDDGQKHSKHRIIAGEIDLMSKNTDKVTKMLDDVMAEEYATLEQKYGQKEGQ